MCVRLTLVERFDNKLSSLSLPFFRSGPQRHKSRTRPNKNYRVEWNETREKRGRSEDSEALEAPPEQLSYKRLRSEEFLFNGVHRAHHGNSMIKFFSLRWEGMRRARVDVEGE
jgi:hypothetical protein